MVNGSLAHRFLNMERRHRYAAAIVVIVILAAVFVYSNTMPRTCYDEVCFMTYANQCAYATYTNTVATATVHYETGSCVLNKTVIAMDPREPESVREDFVGKSMICVFTRNDFSPLYLTTLVSLLDNCEGELKKEIKGYMFY